MVSVNQLSIHFTGVDLFDNATFNIGDRDRIGLVGRNGSGKTTLLRIIAGLQEPQKGEVVVPEDTTIGYLQQEVNLVSNRTVFDEAATAFREIMEISEDMERLGRLIQDVEDHHSAEYLKYVHDLSEANENFKIHGGNTYIGETEKVLSGLGFTRDDLTRRMNEFSSGWQMRVELAKILLRKPSLILLDEPTNHLDIESIQWLEEYLLDYFGAIVVVSHDRAFLDNVTKRTIEITMGKIYDYKAPYSEYVMMREDRLESQMAAYNNQQRQVRQIERFIERFRYKNTKAKQVQSRIKMLEKLEEIEIDLPDASAIHFRFPAAPPSGKVVIDAQGAGKTYGNHTVLQNLDFTILRGDKVAFVGRNGEGKTTLAKMILGKIEFDGQVRTGYQVNIGYFSQNPGEFLDLSKTVFDTIDHIAVGDIRKHIKNLLGAFLFGGDDINKKVRVLSGGEKSRLSLACLLLTPYNLLVLDEPTNHLDMQSKDILKNALLHYDGTLVIVSHDRDFLQGLTNKVYEFRNRGIKEYLGDIYDFLDQRKLRSLKELEQKKPDHGPEENNTIQKTPANKVLREQKKNLDRELRKVRNKVSSCEDEITQLEQQIAEINAFLADPHSGSTGSADIYNRYGELKKNLDKKMEEWEKLTLEEQGWLHRIEGLESNIKQ